MGHEGGQGLADTPLFLRAQIFRDHLDSYLQKERGMGGGRTGRSYSMLAALVRLDSHPGWASGVSTSLIRYGMPGT